MNSHTPAPWFVRKVNSALTIVNSGGGRIAQTTSGKGLPTQQQEADTTLIAAAPDLLDALREMVQTYQDEPMPALYQARAAIAKATGESAVPSLKPQESKND